MVLQTTTACMSPQAIHVTRLAVSKQLSKPLNQHRLRLEGFQLNTKFQLRDPRFEVAKVWAPSKCVLGFYERPLGSAQCLRQMQSLVV